MKFKKSYIIVLLLIGIIILLYTNNLQLTKSNINLVDSIINYQAIIFTNLEIIDNLNNENNNLQDSNSILQDIILIQDKNVTKLTYELNSYKNNYYDLNTTYYNMVNKSFKSRIILYKDLKIFLAKNKVNENKYNIDNFNCVDYTFNLIKDLSQEGYIANSVYIEFNQALSSHLIVSIETEKGLVYIEPQDDRIFTNLEVGEQYLDWGSKYIISKIR